MSEEHVTQEIMNSRGYAYCKDHDIYFPNSKQCCPACQVAIVESYLERLINVREHYQKVMEAWPQESFKITQDMASGQPGASNETTSEAPLPTGEDTTKEDKSDSPDHRTDIFKEQ